MTNLPGPGAATEARGSQAALRSPNGASHRADGAARRPRPLRSWLLSAVLCCTVLLITPPGLALAELRIASWNIQHFGWGQNKSLPAVARVIAKFDIVAIQELMNAEALYELRQALEDDTGGRWEILYSEPLGSGTYREKYAFIWRGDAVEYVDGAVLMRRCMSCWALQTFTRSRRARSNRRSRRTAPRRHAWRAWARRRPGVARLLPGSMVVSISIPLASMSFRLSSILAPSVPRT
jgi:hypothetical protein